MSQQLSEQELVRRESLTKLKALGINPYPQALFPVTALSKDIKENFEEGKKILSESNLKILSATDLNDAAKKIVEAVG